MPRPLFTPGKDPLPLVQEAGRAPGPVWTGAENLPPTVIRSPYHPAPSQSLYRLSYTGPHYLRSTYVLLLALEFYIMTLSQPACTDRLKILFL